MESFYPRFSFFELRILLFFVSSMSFAMVVQGNRVPQIEPTDPLYIHPSDSSGQALITNIFNGENYNRWKRSVMIALSARHKVAFIDGTCVNPGSASPLYIL